MALLASIIYMFLCSIAEPSFLVVLWETNPLNKLEKPNKNSYIYIYWHLGPPSSDGDAVRSLSRKLTKSRNAKQ